jgi:hypothetical protein
MKVYEASSMKVYEASSMEVCEASSMKVYEASSIEVCEALMKFYGLRPNASYPTSLLSWITAPTHSSTATRQHPMS